MARLSVGLRWRRSPFSTLDRAHYYLAESSIAPSIATITRDRTKRSNPWILWDAATNRASLHRLYREARAEHSTLSEMVRILGVEVLATSPIVIVEAVPATALVEDVFPEYRREWWRRLLDHFRHKYEPIDWGTYWHPAGA